MLRVGLTGGIASGKSMAAGFFRQCGAYVIDTDAVSRAVVVPGHEGWKRVVKHFGPDILTPQGHIDRSRLGQIVFSDTEQRKKLNALLHPLIMDAVRQGFQAPSPQKRSGIAVVEVPLLIEGGFQNDFDKIVLIIADRDNQLKRMVKRNGFSRQDGLRRLNAQMDMAHKRPYAHYLLYNNSTTKDLKKQVVQIYRRLQQDIHANNP